MEAVLGSPLLRIRNPFRGMFLNLWSAIAVVLVATMISLTTTGCTVQDQKTAAQDIANALPQLAPYIATAQGIVDTLDPAVAPLVDAGVAAVTAGSALIQAALTNYANSPSATTWGAIVDAVTQTLNQNATTILNLAHVTNPDSRARALVVMGAIQTALLLLLSIVQRVHDAVTSAKVKAAAAAVPMKVSEYRQYLDRNKVEQATGYSFNVAVAYETAQGF
jgi:hypothetical protein